MAYDADCGPCTRFKEVVQVLDRYHRVDFLSLINADQMGLLDSIPQSLKYKSFHLISPNGSIWSGAEALPILVNLFPLGKSMSKVFMTTPIGKRITEFVYLKFSKLHDSGSCKSQYQKTK